MSKKEEITKANPKHEPEKGILSHIGFNLLGLLVALAMPAAAMLVFLAAMRLELSLGEMVNAQLSQPMLWLINFFAVLLVFFFLFNIQTEMKRTRGGGGAEEGGNYGLPGDADEPYPYGSLENPQVEALIGRAKREWEATFDAISDPIIVADATGKIIRCNRATTRILERTYREIIGLRVQEVFPGIASQTDANGRIGVQTILMPSVRTWYELTGFPIQMTQNTNGTIFIFRDVSQRRQAETELQRQKKLFDGLFHNSPSAVVTQDIYGNIVSGNPAFERLFGYPLQELAGRKLDDLIVPVENREQAIEFARRSRKGEIFHEVTRRISKDGREHEVDVTHVPLLLEGESSGMLLLFDDLTNLLKAQRKAEDSDLEKSRFLGKISSEVYPPLNGVIVRLKQALDAAGSPEQNEHLTAALESSEGLMMMLNDMLVLSKIESGQMEIEASDIDLRAVVENTTTGLAQRAEYRGVEFVCMIPPDVPVLVKGDANRLRQVLLNLAGNAVGRSDRGEITIRLKKVNESEDTATIAFFVQNTGVERGEGQGSLSERPDRDDAAAEHRSGNSELGLEISSQLVEMMGGKISVISEPDAGSTFSFAAVFEKQKGSIAGVEKAIRLFRDVRVLVVDPSITSRANLSLLLDHLGCQTAAAPTTIRAWRLLEEAVRGNKPFQVLFIDSKLVLSGSDPILQHIKKTPRVSSIKILLMNLPGQNITRLDCETIGCAGTMQKPVHLDGLRNALGGIFGGTSETVHKEAAPEGMPATNPAGHTTRMQKILLVEDNPVNNKAILAELQKMGHLADLAENGREALELFKKNYYDLVLMDTQVPMMDGFQTTESIRRLENGKETPIIGMAGLILPGEAEHCRECGMNDTLTKPVKPQELFKKIEYWGGGKNKTGNVDEPDPSKTEKEKLPRLGDAGVNFPGELQTPESTQPGKWERPGDTFAAFETTEPESWLEANARAAAKIDEGFNLFGRRRGKPLGDPDYLETTLPRFGGDLAAFLAAFEEFIGQCREKVEDIRLAVQSKDMILTKFLAQRLNRLAVEFAAVEVATLAKDLDTEVACGDDVKVKVIAEAIRGQIPELEKRLKEMEAFLPDQGHEKNWGKN